MPQINNAVHYFVINHNFSEAKSDKVEIKEHTKEHICEQHLHVLSATLVPIFYTSILYRVSYCIKIIYGFVVIYLLCFVFNKFLRGPPAIFVAQ